ncbi:uncharacterized protein BKA55DRAFT_572282, partial [Fusarium redolens]
KNPRRLECCSVDKAVASFHGLRVSSVPFRPNGLGNEPCGIRASRSRAPEGPESRAAEGCLCCSGS